MTLRFKNIHIFSSSNFSEEAERALISGILSDRVFGDPVVRRKLASYVFADFAEKDTLILELMNRLWTLPSANQLFSAFRDFDTAFSLLERKGHFIHQFEVFLLGWNLIVSILPLDFKTCLISKFSSYERLFYSWLLTSTAHDFGYSLQVAKKLCNKFSKLYDAIHIKNLSNKYSTIAKGYDLNGENDLVKVEVYDVPSRKKYVLDIAKFIRDGIQRTLRISNDDAKRIQGLLKKDPNHGYVSAMILCRSYIDYLSKSKIWNSSKERWRIDILRLAVCAIALHALPLKEKRYISKISFNSNPVAYLLLVVDSLQDWARTLRPSEKWPSYNLCDFKSSNDSIYLSYVLSHENWTNDMIRRVQRSLREKADKIKLPSKPKPSLNFHIFAEFESNHGHKFDPISLKM